MVAFSAAFYTIVISFSVICVRGSSICSRRDMCNNSCCIGTTGQSDVTSFEELDQQFLYSYGCSYFCECSEEISNYSHTDAPMAYFEEECKDIYPYNDGYTCEEQVKWGKCNEEFMANACDLSCGRCRTIDKNRAANESLQEMKRDKRNKPCIIEVTSNLLTFNIDVGNCTRIDNVAIIHLELTGAPVSASIRVQLLNTAATILSTVILNTLVPVAIFELTLASTSQGDLQIINHMNSTMLALDQLFLENLALVSKPSLTVRYCYINSSQDFATTLPITTVEAVISVLPSREMLEVQSLLTAVSTIPGAGQLAYSRDQAYDCWWADCRGIPGIAASTDLLAQAVPRLQWVAPVIVWYGDSLRFETMKILPGEEHERTKYDPSSPWPHFHVISRDTKNKPNYGSTVYNDEFLSYIRLLKSKSFKVMVYPMLLLDLPGKPWRGHVTVGNDADVRRAFYRRHGYAEFILHYAQLVKGHADAFIIGSEFKQLTKSIEFVRCLVSLAAEVKRILGQGVIVTYAADWSEYHHHSDGSRTLDELWSSPHIDVVGIDAYFPLQRLATGESTTDDVVHGWESGELWDFYYSDQGAKRELTPEWAIKRLEHWWNSSHGEGSAWVPRMKPIWFTEFGFPSIHRSMNQPNVFWNPHCSDGGTPHHSSGNVDVAAQIKGILATLQYWQNRSHVVQHLFLYAWDVRPYPHFPRRMDLWSDGDQWSRGHWINGKLQPEFTVTLLGAAEAARLVVYANFLEVGPAATGINVPEILAATVRVLGDLSGTAFGVQCSDFLMNRPFALTMSSGLSIQCEACDIIFPSHKVTVRTENSVDEFIQGVKLVSGSLVINCRSLIMYSANVVIAGSFDLHASGDFELISEVEEHSRWWQTSGRRAYGVVGPRSKSGGSERSDVLRQATVAAGEFTFAVKGRFRARAGFISTSAISGFSMRFLFEPVSVERYYHHWTKKTKWFRTRKTDSRSGGTQYDGAILLVAGNAYIFSEVDITIIASTIVGENVTLEAKNIHFLAAVGNYYNHFHLTKKGAIQFSFSSGNGEFAASVGAYFHSQTRNTAYDVAYPTTISATNLNIRARDITIRGGDIVGETVNIVADTITHEPVLLCGFQRYSETHVEVGLKIGFQERVSTFLDSVQDLLGQQGRGSGQQNAPSVVEAVNYISKAKSVLRQAAAYKQAVTGGVWLYGDARHSTQEQYQEWGLNNFIQARVLNVSAKEWTMQNLHITGEDVFLTVDTILGRFGRTRQTSRFSQTQLHGEMNLYGNTDSRVDGDHSTLHTEEVSYSTNTIRANGKLHIKAKRIEGAFEMTASEVQILTHTLHLLSKQDEYSMSMGTQSMSVGFSAGSLGGSASQANERSRITVGGRSGIVARDVLLIHATGAIHLLGAYLDSSTGNLTVSAEDIKAYTLHDYVQGSSMGGGGSVGIVDGNVDNQRVSVGDTDLRRDVRGSIGAGIVIVGGKEIDHVLGSLGDLSRDTSLPELAGHRWSMTADLGAVNLDPLLGRDENDGRDFSTRIADALVDSVNEAVSGMVEGVVHLVDVMTDVFFSADSETAMGAADNNGDVASTIHQQVHAHQQQQSVHRSKKNAEERTTHLTAAVATAKENLQEEETMSEYEVALLVQDTLNLFKYNLQESDSMPTAVLPFASPTCAQSSTCTTKVVTIYNKFVRAATGYYEAAASYVQKHPQVVDAALAVTDLFFTMHPASKVVKIASTNFKLARAARSARVAGKKAAEVPISLATATGQRTGAKVIRPSSLSPESPIQYLDKPGRVKFNDVEYRGVRELSHLSDAQLLAMSKRGHNPVDAAGRKLVYHHHQQKSHLEPGNFVVEVIAKLHRIGNKVQHPLGNKGGISKTVRTDWNKQRQSFNKQRAANELNLRKTEQK